MSLDSGVVTLEEMIVSLVMVGRLGREMREEKGRLELGKGETQDTAVVDLEQVHVEMGSEEMRPTRTPSEGNKYFDSEDQYDTSGINLTFSKPEDFSNPN